MKKFLFVLGLVFMIGCESSNEIIIPIDDEPIGKVLKLDRSEYYNSEGELKHSINYTFNEDGLVTKIVHESPTGLIYTDEYRYVNGNVVYRNVDDIEMDYFYTDGFMTHSLARDSEDRFDNAIYSYNSDNLFETAEYEGGSVHSYYYDSFDRLVSYTNETTELIRTYSFKYDDNNHPLKFAYPDNYFYGQVVNKGNNIIEENSDGSITEFEYTYNSDGYPIQKTTMSQGEIQSVEKFFYK